MSEEMIVPIEKLLEHIDLADLEAGWQDVVKSTFGEETDPVRVIANTPVVALAKSLGVKRSVASSIKNTAEGLLPKEEETVRVEMKGEASAVAMASANATVESPYGPYAAYLVRGASPALGGLGSVNPRINRGFVQAAATAVATFVYLATGVDRMLFDEKFWLDAELEDPAVRKAIFQLTEKMKRGEFVTPESMKSMFDGIGQLLDGQFESLVEVCAEFAGAQEVLSMSRTGGQMDLSRFAAPMAKMGILVPANGEKISKQMRGSAMPEQSGAVSDMIKAMMDIMRGADFATAVRAPAGMSPDEVAVWFMDRRMGGSFANRISLAQAYERLLNLFAVCPPVLTGADKTQYLLAVGTVANEVGAYHALVAPELRKEVQASSASGFPAPVASVSTKAVARAWFDIKLSVSWGKSG